MWPQIGAAAAGVSGAVSGVMYYAAAAPSSQIFGPSLVRAGEPGSKCVALTFDDGPSESTPAVCEALADYGAKATFFQVGGNAERLPEVSRSVARAGHEIGNHTQTHPRFYLRTPGEIAWEIERGQRSLETVLGQRPRLFRPPYGVRWFGLYPALQRHGLRAVMWSVSSYDWERPEEWVAAQVIARAAPGDVVLMHDGDTTVPGDRRQGTARAARAILKSFAERGIRAITVSELFGLQENA